MAGEVFIIRSNHQVTCEAGVFCSVQGIPFLVSSYVFLWYVLL